TELWMCGDGEVEEVADRAKELGIGDMLRHTGWIAGEEREECLKHAMVHVLPSYREALPMSILETMARGIPNISTRIASIPEVIKNGENGRMIEPGDIPALQKAILDIVCDPQRREAMSFEAYKLIQEGFSLHNNVVLLENMYRKMIRNRDDAGISPKRRRRLLMLAAAVLCAALVLFGVSGLCSAEEETEIPALTAYMFGYTNDLSRGYMDLAENSDYNLCFVEIDAQLHEFTSLTVHLPEGTERQAAYLSDSMKVLESYNMTGTTSVPANTEAKYLCIPMKREEYDLIRVIGTLSEAAVKARSESESPFAGKRLSVIGDSLSALRYYVPRGYYSEYPKEDVVTQSMWWHRLALALDMEICEINACAGSGVTDECSAPAALAAGAGRGKLLHDESGDPDVIIALIGGNDVLTDAPTDKIVREYRRMVEDICSSYPQAQIYLCAYSDPDPSESFRMAWLRKEIEDIAAEYGVGMIAIPSRLNSMTYDGSHYTAQGQAEVALVIEQALLADGWRQ
ncbi:MAG: glycosyltransferase, partial [Clostridia bacterium]|nr:glycosyltransferase [Clostridia bacterium]